MGGAAFARAVAVTAGEPTLSTPRMSPEEYRCLRDTILQRLRTQLPDAKVVYLIEAPEKTSYGDIDILIATTQAIDFQELAIHIGAVGSIRHHSKSRSFAIPKDGSLSGQPAEVYNIPQDNDGSRRAPSADVTKEEYAQVDIETVSPELFDWHLFYSSYGDMLGWLGKIVTNLGFTVNDKGLCLRMKESDMAKKLERVNIPQKSGILFLSGDPREVMGFLGLSYERYQTGFTTLDELYTWLGSCRLLHPEAVKIKRDNSHERRREATRKTYSQFFDEWLPAHMDLEVKDADEQTAKIKKWRQQHLEEAVKFFHKEGEFKAKHTELVLLVQNAIAVNLLRPLVAQHSEKDGRNLGELMRSFRRHVAFTRDGVPMVKSTAHTDQESQLYRFLGEDGESLRDSEAASAWVNVHWEELKDLVRQDSKNGDLAPWDYQ